MRNIFYFALALLFISSCKKSNYSYHFNATQPYSACAEPLPAGGGQFKADLSTNREITNSKTIIAEIKHKTNGQISSRNTPPAFVQKAIEKNKVKLRHHDDSGNSKKEKKEMSPRLARGLVMTIFGGVITAFGIIMFPYAPTGLLTFAFGIVFIVGLVTLIMYLANPKPKM